MNTRKTKQLVEELNVVPLKADKTGKSPEVDQLLIELGNNSKGIPFYAIFPGDGSEPITFGGLITQEMLLDQLRRVEPGVGEGVDRTAMRKADESRVR